jgi:gluconolactonase
MRKRAHGFLFVEGPVWHAERERLIFSDIPSSRLYEFDPATDEVELYRFPSNMTNGNAFDHQHRLLSCEHATSRVVREEPDGTLTVLASEYRGSELNSPNDVIVDREGRVVFTDPPFGRGHGMGLARPLGQAHMGVYRVDPRDASIDCLADDFAAPNGLCFAEDESVLFVNDTTRMHIRRFETIGGAVAGGEVWAELPAGGPGLPPDGMKIDTQGNLYCCGPGGIHVFTGDRAHPLGVVRTPEAVANFNWGDPDRRTLYLTATTSLYSLRVRVPGPALW